MPPLLLLLLLPLVPQCCLHATMQTALSIVNGKAADRSAVSYALQGDQVGIAMSAFAALGAIAFRCGPAAVAAAVVVDDDDVDAASMAAPPTAPPSFPPIRQTP